MIRILSQADVIGEDFFSEGLHWIIENNYNQLVAHYLDDFLLVGCQDQDLFSKLCERLGFEEKLSKAMDGYVVDFTGIELDSDKMEALKTSSLVLSQQSNKHYVKASLHTKF